MMAEFMCLGAMFYGCKCDEDYEFKNQGSILTAMCYWCSNIANILLVKFSSKNEIRCL